MLGNGRPFVVELISPKKRIIQKDDFLKLENQINGVKKNLDPTKEIDIKSYINILNLGFTTNKCFEELTIAAKDKTKMYCCIVRIEESFENSEKLISDLNQMKDIHLKQRTPIRVLGRRAPLVREKLIHRINLKPLNNKYAICFLLTSAGTYVKEFIHSDLNRTRPSLKDFINSRCDILQLDVMKLYKNFSQEVSDDFDAVLKEYLNKLNYQ